MSRSTSPSRTTAHFWADPYLTVPEAARLLRLGGLLVFTHYGPISTIATPYEPSTPRNASSTTTSEFMRCPFRWHDQLPASVRDLSWFVAQGKDAVETAVGEITNDSPVVVQDLLFSCPSRQAGS